jgi:hypothetical protein
VKKTTPVYKKTPVKNGKKKKPEVVPPSTSDVVLMPTLGTK